MSIIFIECAAEGRRQNKGVMYGFPMVLGSWCNSDLKMPPLDKLERKKNAIKYIGYAIDEKKEEASSKKYKITLTVTHRAIFAIHSLATSSQRLSVLKYAKSTTYYPPIYTQATRGGCWFCHNQGVGQLRSLRRQYPEYWALMLKWDTDSPVTFKPDGHTVHDFDRRFQLEDDGFIAADDKVFRWEMLEREFKLQAILIGG